MAHADSACCAVCDEALYYATDREAKDVVCSHCTLTLFKSTGVEIFSVSDLVAWFKGCEDPGPALYLCGYRPCYYGSHFDGIVQNH